MMAAFSDRGRKWFATNNVVWLTELVAEMMGVPNSWRRDDAGFVKDVEVPEYLEVLEFVRRCWAEDLIHPSAFDANFSLQTQALYNSGVAPMVIGGLAWPGNAAGAKVENPAAESVSFPLPTWDGSGLARRWVGTGAPYQVAVKAASKERIEEILRIVNWMASPWGTEEYLLARSGIEGHNYERGESGSPIALKGPAPVTVSRCRRCCTWALHHRCTSVPPSRSTPRPPTCTRPMPSIVPNRSDIWVWSRRPSRPREPC